MSLRTVIPELGVASIERSVAFYREVLGFQFSTRHEEEGGVGEGQRGAGWACIKSGSVRMYLHQSRAAADPAGAAQRACVKLWFRPVNLEELHHRLLAKGFPVTELTCTSHGTRECSLPDPDGYTVCLQEFLFDLAEAPPD